MKIVTLRELSAEEIKQVSGGAFAPSLYNGSTTPTKPYVPPPSPKYH